MCCNRTSFNTERARRGVIDWKGRSGSISFAFIQEVLCHDSSMVAASTQDEIEAVCGYLDPTDERLRCTFKEASSWLVDCLRTQSFSQLRRLLRLFSMNWGA